MEKGRVETFLEEQQHVLEKAAVSETQTGVLPRCGAHVPMSKLQRSLRHDHLCLMLELPPGHPEGPRKEFVEKRYESRKVVLSDVGKARLPFMMGVLHDEVLSMLTQDAGDGDVLFIDGKTIELSMNFEKDAISEEYYTTVQAHVRAIIIPSNYGRPSFMGEDGGPEFLWEMMGFYGVEAISAAVEKYSNENFTLCQTME